MYFSPWLKMCCRHVQVSAYRKKEGRDEGRKEGRTQDSNFLLSKKRDVYSYFHSYFIGENSCHV
jgi:hypothetical protein